MFEQVWRNQEYEPRSQVYLRSLPKNHLVKLRAVKFDWVDYKIYENLGCLPYERMIVRCQYFLQNRECRDIKTLFQNCVTTNNALGYLKRTQPEYFAENEYSRAKATFEQLAI